MNTIQDYLHRINELDNTIKLERQELIQAYKVYKKLKNDIEEYIFVKLKKDVPIDILYKVSKAITALNQSCLSNKYNNRPSNQMYIDSVKIVKIVEPYVEEKDIARLRNIMNFSN